MNVPSEGEKSWTATRMMRAGDARELTVAEDSDSLGLPEEAIELVHLRDRLARPPMLFRGGRDFLVDGLRLPHYHNSMLRWVDLFKC